MRIKKKGKLPISQIRLVMESAVGVLTPSCNLNRCSERQSNKNRHEPVFKRHWASWWSRRGSATKSPPASISTLHSHTVHMLVNLWQNGDINGCYVFFTVSFSHFFTERQFQNAKLGGFVHLSYGIVNRKHKHDSSSRKEGRNLDHVSQLNYCCAAVTLCHHFTSAAFACTLSWSAFILQAVNAHTLNVLWGWSEFWFIVPACLVKMTRCFFLNNGRILWIPRKAPGGHSKNQTINYLVNKK